ncbi:MAG: hypothetical protein M3273_05210 [Actinomycetota bacterium]|nr:hypothetical protein [Actinomycetota bacterium]
MRRIVAAPAALLLLLVSCFGSNPDVSESGKGKPVLSVEFPERVEGGSAATATLTVENPGPGDMRSVVVAFAAVGAPASEGLPAELVPIASDDDNPAIASVEPEPAEVSPDGVVYVFDGLRAGESVDIRFEIIAPESAGRAASSVSVYDGGDTTRIRGLRLETLVTG